MTTYDIKRLVLALAIYAEIEGMKAENEQRKITCESMAYTEDSFQYAACELRELANKHDHEL